MSVLIAWRLEETHGWQIADRSGSVEILNIVLVFSPTVMPDFGQRSGTGVI